MFQHLASHIQELYLCLEGAFGCSNSIRELDTISGEIGRYMLHLHMSATEICNMLEMHVLNTFLLTYYIGVYYSLAIEVTITSEIYGQVAVQVQKTICHYTILITVARSLLIFLLMSSLGFIIITRLLLSCAHAHI